MPNRTPLGMTRERYNPNAANPACASPSHIFTTIEERKIAFTLTLSLSHTLTAMKTILVAVAVVALIRRDVEARASSPSCVRENADQCGVLMAAAIVTDS
jgi:hypothetical protein